MPRTQAIWRISIDTGGTFTDAIGIDPDGQVHRAKILSTSALRGRIKRVVQNIDVESGQGVFDLEQPWPGGDDLVSGGTLHVQGLDDVSFHVERYESQHGRVTYSADKDVASASSAFEAGVTVEVRCDEEAPVLAARMLTSTPSGGDLPPLWMRLATTRGTNALLERRGGPVALFITQGLTDLLYIGDQRRPDLFSLEIHKPRPLAEMACAVCHRRDAQGEVLTPLDEDDVRRQARSCREQNVRNAAVALLHGYVNGDDEQRIAAILHDEGFEHISISSALSPTIGLLNRAQTAVVDAYLSPVINLYLKRVRESVGIGPAGSQLHVMTSAGGLVGSDRYHAKDSLLSGPAGGVAGAAAAGRQSGFERVIGFDMGGTSTDVCRYDGDYEYQFELVIGDVKLATPALAIETVAAGGGSICTWKHGELRVGPHSAGADPGPACYGAGGPLTLTDVNLLLGRLDHERFEIPIDRSAAERALDALLQQVSEDSGETIDRHALLEGFLRLTDERMADAIVSISLRRGYDPSEYALVSFGGAGGQHACRIAELLNIDRVVMPADASLLSAYGLQHALIERFAERQVLRPLNEIESDLPTWLDELANQATDDVAAEGVTKSDINIRRRIVNLRLLGQDATLAVEVADVPQIDVLHDTFREKYRAQYGHVPAGNPIEVESMRVVASSRAETNGKFGNGGDGRRQSKASGRPTPIASAEAWFDGKMQSVNIYERGRMNPGDSVEGPTIIFESRSTYVIESDWRATLDEHGALLLEKRSRAAAARGPTAAQDGVGSDLVRRDLFMHRFTAIAREMGQVLQMTALSTNVKQRMDFSCALLDSSGRLLVNAPHIPVHLGAMGICVREVSDRLDLHPGDVIVTNHPAFGGSHLPDVTVITPVFVNSASTERGHPGHKSKCESPILLGYAASRAHHAEIGGTRPGSMPPAARTLVEEGVVIAPMYLVKQFESQFESIEELLRAGPHRSRAANDNLADLRAAVAANNRAAESLQNMAAVYGLDEVQRQMQLIFDRAVDLSGKAIRQLPPGEMNAEERLDDGSVLCVRIVSQNGRATIDFTGSAPQHPGNLNATPAIVTSAVLYVLRTLIGEQLPLSEGILDVVDLIIPQGTLLSPQFIDNPSECPAVVGGNTETSQRLVDTLFKAMGGCACSQGTMNNVLFGNDRFSYYETICGGAGAGPGFNGADAVHTHMTNTAITDPEIIEHRYPVQLHRFEIRRKSGGDGLYRGGDGVIREFEFLQPMLLSMLSQHRVESPYGFRGASPGATGRQCIVRADGLVCELSGMDAADVEPGDRFVVETPGGGGANADEVATKLLEE